MQDEQCDQRFFFTVSFTPSEFRRFFRIDFNALINNMHIQETIKHE